jgi:hypothetical protein
MRRWFPVLAVVCTVALPLAGCAPRAGRCYLPATRYEPLKELFHESGSMARVEEVMEQEDWAPCERNQLRYFLTRDLYLEMLEREQLAVPPSGLRFAALGGQSRSVHGD